MLGILEIENPEEYADAQDWLNQQDERIAKEILDIFEGLQPMLGEERIFDNLRAIHEMIYEKHYNDSIRAQSRILCESLMYAYIRKVSLEEAIRVSLVNMRKGMPKQIITVIDEVIRLAKGKAQAEAEQVRKH